MVDERTVDVLLHSVYRVQDAEGRGPWRPGFSHLWVRERDDHENLLPFYEQFGWLTVKPDCFPAVTHFGCACRTLEQLRRWFTPDEYETLQSFGYRAVRMDVDRVLAESSIQLVFQRSRPLRTGVEPVELYGISDELPPRVKKED